MFITLKGWVFWRHCFAQGQKDGSSTLIWFKINQMKAKSITFQSFSFGKRERKDITDFVLKILPSTMKIVVLLSIEINLRYHLTNISLLFAKKATRTLVVLKHLDNLLTRHGQLAIFNIKLQLVPFSLAFGSQAANIYKLWKYKREHCCTMIINPLFPRQTCQNVDLNPSCMPLIWNSLPNEPWKRQYYNQFCRLTWNSDGPSCNCSICR